MDEVFMIRDLETLRAIADTRRLDIIFLLETPRTASQVAEHLGESGNSIYYHINELEKKGLVRLVETRLKGHLTEKYYQASARVYTVTPGLLEGNFDLLVDTNVAYNLHVLDNAAAKLKRAHAAHVFSPQNLEESIFYQKQIRLSSQRLRALVQQINQVIEEFENDDAPTGEQSSLLTILLHPVVESSPETQADSEPNPQE
jgi:DNA-binding transcriptional ArsR family regulator